MVSRGSRPKWGYYNPLRPEPQQANRVLSVRDELAPRRPMGSDIVEASREAGVLGMDQIRVLLCEGPVLLAWVGGFRSETIDATDRALFASIVPALLKRVKLDNQLRGASLRDAAFGPVLEALGTPALILRPKGAIALTNAAARALLDQDGSTWRERLSSAVTGAAIPGIELTPFPVAGSRPHLLALLRPAVNDEDDTSVRARLVGGKWGLTPRHIEVLERLAWGDSNKSIAARLGCSERTVENHLTAIMERVDVDSRAELVARFWTAK